MTFSPNSSIPQTALTLPAGVATPIPAFPMYGASRWSLVIKNTGANDVTACTTAKYAHEVDTNPGPDTNLDSKIVTALTAGSSITVEAADVSYEKIQFTLTSTSGTAITYSFQGRS